MRMSNFLMLLGLLTVAGPLTLLAVMNKRQMRGKFAMFFNYLVLMAIASVALQVSNHFFSRESYFYVYWVFTALLMLAGFAVLYEVFITILKPYSAVIDLGKMLFWWAAFFLFLTALLTAMATTGPQVSKICTAIQLLEHCVQLMQCGLLLLVLTFDRRLGLSLRSHGMCIAFGLGTFAASDLTITYLFDRMPHSQTELNLINGAVSVGLYCFWIMGLLSPEPQRRTAQDSPTRVILQRWNEALMATPFVRSGELAFSQVDSFLPGVEKTVERVLARKMSD
jgi:hypothetical protein